MYEIFQKLLQALGVDSATVSRAINVPQSTIANWKSRNNLISAEIGIRIAKYFNITLDYLYMGIEPSPSGLTEEESCLVLAYRHASADEQRIMSGIAEQIQKREGRSSDSERKEETA